MISHLLSWYIPNVSSEQKKRLIKSLWNCITAFSFDISCVVLRTALPYHRSLFLGITKTDFKNTFLFRILCGMVYSICRKLGTRNKKRETRNKKQFIKSASKTDILLFLVWNQFLWNGKNPNTHVSFNIVKIRFCIKKMPLLFARAFFIQKLLVYCFPKVLGIGLIFLFNRIQIRFFPF